MKTLRIEDIQDRIVSTEKVAHVTFYLVKEYEGSYLVYSESEKRPLQLVDDPTEYDIVDQRLHYGGVPYEEALTILREAIEALERRLERKRTGLPTQKQLLFFFRNKIPIPVDLTWGQASDRIEECLAQAEIEKQTRRLERFNGLVEGDRVSWTWGKITRQGKITKLYQAGAAGKFAHVEMEDGNTYRIQGIEALHKLDQEV